MTARFKINRQQDETVYRNSLALFTMPSTIGRFPTSEISSAEVNVLPLLRKES